MAEFPVPEQTEALTIKDQPQQNQPAGTIQEAEATRFSLLDRGKIVWNIFLGKNPFIGTQKGKALEARLSRVISEQSGVCENLPTERLDHDRTVDVTQQGYALAHPSLAGATTLQTFGLATCVALGALSSETKLGFLTHLDRAGSVPNALQLIRQYLGGLAKLVIYGGRVADRSIIATIEDGIGKDMVIIGKKTFNEKTSYEEFTAIALDTATGRFFIPYNIKTNGYRETPVVKRPRGKKVDYTLHNDGPPWSEIEQAMKAENGKF